MHHSSISTAGVYLVLLMQFLENKVAVDLTRSEFVEAQGVGSLIIVILLTHSSLAFPPFYALCFLIFIYTINCIEFSGTLSIREISVGLTILFNEIHESSGAFLE